MARAVFGTQPHVVPSSRTVDRPASAAAAAAAAAVPAGQQLSCPAMKTHIDVFDAQEYEKTYGVGPTTQQLNISTGLVSQVRRVQVRSPANCRGRPRTAHCHGPRALLPIAGLLALCAAGVHGEPLGPPGSLPLVCLRAPAGRRDRGGGPAASPTAAPRGSQLGHAVADGRQGRRQGSGKGGQERAHTGRWLCKLRPAQGTQIALPASLHAWSHTALLLYGAAGVVGQHGARDFEAGGQEHSGFSNPMCKVRARVVA